MAKNYFNRYVWLVDLVNRYGHITFEEISRMWERSSLNETGGPLPERTFFNHMQAIKDTFGIRIRCDRSLGYYIENDTTVREDSIKLWMLQSLSINNIINDSFPVRNRILFEEETSINKWLPDVVKAMRDNKKLKITYTSYQENQTATFSVAPFCLKQYKRRWYLLAETEGNPENKPEIYAMDRIGMLSQTNTDFELPEHFDASEHFRNHIGLMTGPDEKVETIEVKMSPIIANYMRSINLHPSQEEIRNTSEYSVFRYRLVPDIEFLKEILCFGSNAEILTPEWLREKIKEEAMKMSGIYKH